MINLSYEGTAKGLMEYIGNEICEDCKGTGIVYTSVLIRGGNIPPEGYYDYEPRVCQCQRSDYEQDRTEE